MYMQQNAELRNKKKSRIRLLGGIAVCRKQISIVVGMPNREIVNQ
jgi:hypothetical protein